jgi:hypothetical protein
MECLLDHTFQRSEYERLLIELKQHGYTSWFLLDNFGFPIIRTNDLADVFRVFQSVWDQTHGLRPRIIYCIDLLAFTDKQTALVDAAISAFVPGDMWRPNR